MRGFLVALQTLTIIPTKLQGTVREDDLTKSRVYFPLVGLLLGVVLVLVNLISSFLFPPLAAKALVLTALVIFTGALPLEGFANACEGFFSRKGREETLSVMRENRLGVKGGISLIFLLLVKLALLYGLVKVVEFRALLLMPVIGRWAMVIIGTYAGEMSKEDNVSACNKNDYRGPLRASIITFIISLLLFRFFVIPLMLIVYLSILAVRWFSMKKLGGVTSEVLGATVELMEVVALMLIIFMIK